jgi:uncharacterized membrane protein
LIHLWQRFLLASSLVVGLFIGIATTVFGYSNLTTVNVHWSIVHIDGVPLWTVAVVPLALFVVAGTLYHWMNGLHHFSEHMRHRHRVHELEAEVASLRAHLDHVLEMPDHSTSRLPERKAITASLPAPDERTAEVVSPGAEPMVAEAGAPPQSTMERHIDSEELSPKKSRSAHRKRVTLEVGGGPRQLDRSGSHVEGMSGDGTAAEPAHSLESEV